MIEALAILSPLVLGLLLGIRSQARWRRTCREAAAQIYREVSEMYAGTHEYRIARDSDFPGLELSGYLEVRSFLLARSFRHSGWLENLTVTRVHPAHRTGIDGYVDPDGTTTAASFHLAGRQYVTLGSVLAGDRFLVTGNTDLDTLVPPPAVDKCTLPHDTPLADLVARHYQRPAGGAGGRSRRSAPHRGDAGGRHRPLPAALDDRVPTPAGAGPADPGGDVELRHADRSGARGPGDLGGVPAPGGEGAVGMSAAPAGHRLALVPGTFVVCRLGPDEAVPPGMTESRLVSITRTPHELSIVCAAPLAPPGARCEGAWSCLEVQGPLPFSATGILASLAVPLAAAGVSIFAISTYRHGLSARPGGSTGPGRGRAGRGRPPGGYDRLRTISVRSSVALAPAAKASSSRRIAACRPGASRSRGCDEQLDQARLAELLVRRRSRSR